MGAVYCLSEEVNLYLSLGEIEVNVKYALLGLLDNLLAYIKDIRVWLLQSVESPSFPLNTYFFEYLDYLINGRSITVRAFIHYFFE